MKRAMIDPSRCVKCQSCKVETDCTQRAVIKESPDDKPWIDFQLCRGCMKCKIFCPNGAVVEIVQPCNGSSKMSW